MDDQEKLKLLNESLINEEKPRYKPSLTNIIYTKNKVILRLKHTKKGGGNPNPIIVLDFED